MSRCAQGANDGQASNTKPFLCDEAHPRRVFGSEDDIAGHWVFVSDTLIGANIRSNEEILSDTRGGCDRFRQGDSMRKTQAKGPAFLPV